MTEYSPADLTTENGYQYDATSAMWKGLCNDLPCNQLMAWPGYTTASLPVQIEGKPAVIQCWKGWCQEFIPNLSLPAPIGEVSFPGGFGAEVGVYRVDDGRVEPALPTLPATWPAPLQDAVNTSLKSRISNLGYPYPTGFWWPANDLIVESGVPVSFSMFDPLYNDALIEGYSTSTYWTCKWMHPLSYTKWCLDWQRKHTEISLTGVHIPLPPLPADYRLEFSIAGIDYIWADSSGIKVVASALP